MYVPGMYIQWLCFDSVSEYVHPAVESSGLCFGSVSEYVSVSGGYVPIQFSNMYPAVVFRFNSRINISGGCISIPVFRIYFRRLCFDSVSEYIYTQRVHPAVVFGFRVRILSRLGQIIGFHLNDLGLSGLIDP